MIFLRVFFVAILTLFIVESTFAWCKGDPNAYEDECSNQICGSRVCYDQRICTQQCTPGCSCNSGFFYLPSKQKCVCQCP